MKLLILAVGQKMPTWINDGYNEYVKRMPREMRIQLVELKPDRRASGTTATQVKSIERDRILAAIPAHAIVWALDERGEQFGTLELADQLRKTQETGGDICFIIGGADGLHDDVKRRGNQLFSLSRLTLPHGLVRVILAEQLYRAWSVMHNHPYHRE